MRSITRISLIAVTLIGCVGCDQVSKGVARAYLAPGMSYSFGHDILRLTHAENPGAFLSLGATLPEHARIILFTGLVGLVSIGALLRALLARGLGMWQITALSFVAAGGFGNWIDRLTRGGRVTDFLNLGVGPLRTGIFNVADMVLMVGVVLLVLAKAGPGASDNRLEQHI